MDVLSNASGVTSHLLMGRYRATEMNLQEIVVTPVHLKRGVCAPLLFLVSCDVNFVPWRRLYAYHKVAGSCTSPVLILIWIRAIYINIYAFRDIVS